MNNAVIETQACVAQIGSSETSTENKLILLRKLKNKLNSIILRETEQLKIEINSKRKNHVRRTRTCDICGKSFSYNAEFESTCEKCIPIETID